MEATDNNVNQTWNSTVTLKLTYVLITGTSSSLSILGAMVIFWTYFKIIEIQNLTRRLLLYLTLADVITSVGHLIAVGRYIIENREETSASRTVVCEATNGTSVTYGTSGTFKAFDTYGDSGTYHIGSVCVIQSFLTTYFNLVSYFWTVTIAIHLWSSVVLKSRRTGMLHSKVVYHVMCWIVPISIVYPLLFMHKLGEDSCYGTGVWCGIRAVLPDHKLYQYIADVAWQIASYLIITVLYIHLKYYLKLYYHGQRLAMVAGRLRNEDENFLFVWIVIYLLKLWGLVRFFIMAYVPPDMLYNNQTLNKLLKFLLIMQSYGASGQAFWNCIFFCFMDKTVRHKIMSFVRCKNNRETENMSINHSTQNTDIL